MKEFEFDVYANIEGKCVYTVFVKAESLEMAMKKIEDRLWDDVLEDEPTNVSIKNINQVQELLFKEKGINWNDYPTKYRRGSCCVKDTISEGIAIRSSWRIDNEIPIFVEEGRNYIEKLI